MEVAGLVWSSLLLILITLILRTKGGSHGCVQARDGAGVAGYRVAAAVRYIGSVAVRHQYGSSTATQPAPPPAPDASPRHQGSQDAGHRQPLPAFDTLTITAHTTTAPNAGPPARSTTAHPCAATPTHPPSMTPMTLVPMMSMMSWLSCSARGPTLYALVPALLQKERKREA